VEEARRKEGKKKKWREGRKGNEIATHKFLCNGHDV